MEPQHSQKGPPTLRELYPHFTDEQLEEADRILDGYLRVVLRIYDRICSDPEAYKEFKKMLKEKRLERKDI